MTIFDFMHTHPWLTFFLCVLMMFTMVGVAEGLGPKKCKIHKD